ncbi:MAG: DUF2973 domain-containing protein [Coleofasciculaceae cyanobacterium SM2_1_6]|nr:DUF2973 domain-containing protein [Coleofasciculaceae cyanobacterium SM2_1_6]
MLHLIYLVVFTILALLAISNLLRSLVTLSVDSQRQPTTAHNYPYSQNSFRANQSPHPELLDTYGNPINEPLLVMRSLSVEDARQQLDDIYHKSPSSSPETSEEL